MLNLDSVSTFITIVAMGSFTDAARQLGLSKSVVSERLSELERELGGGRLAQRTTRKMSLTEDGHAFLPRARRILQEAQDGRDELAEARVLHPGRSTVVVEVRINRIRDGVSKLAANLVVSQFVIPPGDHFAI